MNTAAIVLWGLAGLALLATLRQGGQAVGGALRFSRRQLRVILPTLAMALPAAGFIAELVPAE